MKIVIILVLLLALAGVSDRAFLKQRLLVKAEQIVGKGVIIDLLCVNIFERLVK